MSSLRTGLVLIVSFLLLSTTAFGEVIHSGGTYTSSTTWSNNDPVHVVTGNVSVGSGATLTIEPGCTVLFATGVALNIYGGLQAVGNSGSGITFTRREADDEWSGLSFSDGSHGTLEYCTIEYVTRYDGRAVNINDGDVSIAHCVLRNNDYGIYYYNTVGADLSVANTFTDNILGGLFFHGCSDPFVDNQTITGSTGDRGAMHFQGTAGFELGGGNVLTGNSWAVSMDMNSAPAFGTVGHIPTAGNTHNDGLGVTGGTLTADRLWPDLGVAYVMTANGSVANTRQLEIEAGSTLLFGTGVTINIYGVLRALGSAAEPILFSRRTETDEWSGLSFAAGSMGQLTYCTVEHATRYDGRGLSINTAEVSVENCLLRHNDYGIYYYHADGVVLGMPNTFTDNTEAGLYFNGGLGASVSQQTITGSTGMWGAMHFVGCRDFTVGPGNNLTGNTWAVGMDMNSSPTPQCAGNIPTSGNTNNDGLRVSGGTQTADRLWPDVGVPYIMTANGSVGSGVTLDIDAGATLLFGTGVAINIYGTLNGMGLASAPVLFSRRTAADEWSGLSYATGSDGRLEHCILEYATRYDGRALNLASADVVVRDCTLRHNDHGIYYYQCAGVQLDWPNIFIDNGLSGVYFNGCTDPVVAQQSIIGSTGSWGALYFSGTTGFLLGEGNVLNGNSWAVSMNMNSAPAPGTAGRIPTSGNTNNDGLRVDGGTVTANRYWPDLGAPYVLTANGSVGGGLCLDIGAGATLLFGTGVAINIYGHLEAAGTGAAPVHFTRRTPVDEWSGLSFANNATGLLQHTTVEYATRYSGRGLYVADGVVELENCHLTHNDTGAYVAGGTLAMLNSTVTNNLEYGLYLSGNAGLALGSSMAEWNDIHTNGDGNPDRDLRNGTHDVFATYVYWGTVTGAEIEARIHHQPDDAGLGLVHYSPWLNAAHDTEYTGGPSAVPEPGPEELPRAFAALGCAPNPFNPATEIRYDLPKPCHVRLEVLDVAGRRVALLVDGPQAAGHKAMTWRPGARPSGVYFYRLEAGEHRATGKMLLLK